MFNPLLKSLKSGEYFLQNILLALRDIRVYAEKSVLAVIKTLGWMLPIPPVSLLIISWIIQWDTRRDGLIP